VYSLKDAVLFCVILTGFMNYVSRLSISVSLPWGESGNTRK